MGIQLHQARSTRLALTATAGAFLVTMMGTTLPTPLYAVYATRLAFTDLTVTVLFAVYALGVVGALALFGRLSDLIGRRPVMLIAVGLAIVSAGLFLLPPALPGLAAARVVSGLAAGLMSGTGTAAVIDLFPPDRRTAAGRVAVGVNTGGLALGTLMAGVLADLGSAALVVPFVVYLLLAASALVALWAVAPRGDRGTRSGFRVQRLRVPASIRGAFVRAVLGGGAAFAMAGVLTAVSAVFLARYLHRPEHWLAGAVVFLVFAGMAAGQLLARPRQAHLWMRAGCCGLVVAAALIGVALGGRSLPALLVAALVLGPSGGLCLNAAVAGTVQRVEVHRRGEVSSTLFAGLYLMLAVPAIGVGLLAAWIELPAAGIVFAAGVAVLAAAVAVAELITDRRAGR